jgi:hypothetical protein
MTGIEHYNDVDTLRRRYQQLLYNKEAQKVAHFLHVGKTGGTAIKSVLWNWVHKCRYIVVMHTHEIGMRDVPVGEKVFFCVRDPCTRFVSAFNSRKQKKDQTYSEEQAFAVFETASDLAEALTTEDRNRRAEAVHAMQSIAHVRDHLTKWFGTDCLTNRGDDILTIGHQETLAESFEVIKLKLDLPRHLRLPGPELEAYNRGPAESETELSEKAVTNLKSWYNADYQLLFALDD